VRCAAKLEEYFEGNAPSSTCPPGGRCGYPFQRRVWADTTGDPLRGNDFYGELALPGRQTDRNFRDTWAWPTARTRSQSSCVFIG